MLKVTILFAFEDTKASLKFKEKQLNVLFFCMNNSKNGVKVFYFGSF